MTRKEQALVLFAGATIGVALLQGIAHRQARVLGLNGPQEFVLGTAVLALGSFVRA